MSPRDRAAELAGVRDLWPVILAEIPEARADVLADAAADLAGIPEAELEEKFRKGEAEHDRGWLRMSREQLEREIRAELADLILYRGMVRARWRVSAGAFTTNADPGDEQPGA